MATLPTDRSTNDTRQEHVGDHNELHRLHNELDGLSKVDVDDLTERVEVLEAGGGGGGLTVEQAMDYLGGSTSPGEGIVPGNNIDVTYDDLLGKITIAVESLTSTDITDFNSAVDTRIAGATIDADTLNGDTSTDIQNAVVAAIVDSAPVTLDTLNELAAALGDDASFATTVTNALAGKQAVNSTLTDLIARWVAASTAGPASLDFPEDTDNGSHRVRAAAPSALAADRTATWPDRSGTIALDERAIRSESSNYTTVADDDIILVDASGGAVTVTLITAAGRAGKTQTIKRQNTGANTVTVDGNGSETIDGSATFVLTIAKQSITVCSDGTNWVIV